MPRISIDTVVFDVGKVLIDYSYQEFFALLGDRGARIDGVEDFARQVELARYEHGELDCSAFLAGINRLLAEPLAEARLKTAWNALFTPLDEMLDFASSLKGGYRVFLLSNIGRLHWEHLLSSYALDALCDDRLASFEAGAMKPSARIFAAAEQRFRLHPEATVFIDDRRENVDGAIACGWHAVHHHDSRTTRRTLMELLDEN